MDFQRDEVNRPLGGAGVQWTKEQSRSDKRFDFAAFLGPDGESVPPAEEDGEPAPEEDDAPRGRHEIPGEEPEDDEGEEENGEEAAQPAGPPRFISYTQDGDIKQPEQPRTPFQAPETAQRPAYKEEPVPQRHHIDEPPPRPKVVVAEPAKRVYVTPPQVKNAPPPPEKGKKGRGGKILAALLLSLVAVVGVAVLASNVLSRIGMPGASPSPSPTAGQSQQAPAVIRPTDVPRNVNHYTITVTSGGGGVVSPGGSVSVEEGRSVSFSIVPNEGYEIAQVLVDGANISVTGSYTFSDVRQDHTLYAVFQATAPAEPTATPEPPPVTDPPPTDVPVTEPPITEPPPVTEVPVTAPPVTDVPEAPPVTEVTPEPAPPAEG